MAERRLVKGLPTKEEEEQEDQEDQEEDTDLLFFLLFLFFIFSQKQVHDFRNLAPHLQKKVTHIPQRLAQRDHKACAIGTVDDAMIVRQTQWQHQAWLEFAIFIHWLHA